MDVLDKLQRTLDAVNKVALSRMHPGDALEMHNERVRLQEWVRSSSRLESVPLVTMESALNGYRQYKYLKGVRQIRLVCYGCTQGPDAVIESREEFARLLDYVERYQDRRRTFRKFYRALLGGYFSYDPDAATSAGRGNWEKLRKFLACYLDSFPLTEFTPDWLATLARYPDLLGEHPGGALDVAVLQGDWSLFGEISEQLELGGDSWLVRKLVMSPILAVEGMDDQAYRHHLPGLLLLLNEYPLYAGAGLKILLDRHAGCTEHEVDDALGEFAIALWGNPWLAAQQWQCGEPAREMLSLWLKRQLLCEFFGILSDDDEAHQRRLNFWDIYSGDLKGLYFALGQDAYASKNLPLYKFRRHAKGLIAKFPEEKHGVHVCIMQFEHHHVVEFNREDSAAYFYDARQGMPSFYFGKGWIDIGAVGVQEIVRGADLSRLSEPMRHRDGRELTWEGKFAQKLGMTDKAIAVFCRKYQCTYEYVHSGSRWIRPACPEQYGREVWSVLKGWGFSHSAKERAYFLPSLS